MKTYQVILTKSYTVTIKTDHAQKARRFAEFYTNDIADISSQEDRDRLNFSIGRIECGMNESLEANEVKEN